MDDNIYPVCIPLHTVTIASYQLENRGKHDLEASTCFSLSMAFSHHTLNLCREVLFKIRRCK